MQPRVIAPESIEPWLGAFIAELPHQRAQPVKDQIQAAIELGDSDGLVAVGVHIGQSPFPCAAVIAIHPRPDWPDHYVRAGITRVEPHSDVALVCHGGSVVKLTDQQQATAAGVLSQAFEQALRDRGIRMVHWTTPATSDLHSPLTWPTALGFEWLADVQYHAIDLALPVADRLAANSPVHLRPLDWAAGPQAIEAFMKVLKQTLAGSLDCPRLMEIQTIHELIAMYQSSAAFAPEGWFTIHRSETGQANAQMTSDPIGVVMWAMHDPTTENGVMAMNRVAEIVYLGLIPEHRGHGLGQKVLTEVHSRLMTHQVERLILAVDQRNHFALRMYQRFGMQPVTKEGVWIKPLPGSP